MLDMHQETMLFTGAIADGKAGIAAILRARLQLRMRRLNRDLLPVYFDNAERDD